MHATLTYTHDETLPHKPVIREFFGATEDSDRVLIEVEGKTWNVSHDMFSNIDYGYLVDELGGASGIETLVFLSAPQSGLPGVGQTNLLDQHYVNFGFNLSRSTDGELSSSKVESALAEALPAWASVADFSAPRLEQ